MEPIIDDEGNKLFGFSLKDIEEYNKQLQETRKKVEDNTLQLKENTKVALQSNKLHRVWMVIISIIVILIIIFLWWLHSSNFTYFLIKNIKTLGCK